MISYFFMSFACLHTGRTLGCCVVQASSLEEAQYQARTHGLRPRQCHSMAAMQLDEAGFREQGIKLNRLYARQQMIAMGFQRDARH